MDPKVNFGPVVSKGQFEKILGYFDIAKKEGLELAVGGKRSNRTGYFIEPTIYTNVSLLTIIQFPKISVNRCRQQASFGGKKYSAPFFV